MKKVRFEEQNSSTEDIKDTSGASIDEPIEEPTVKEEEEEKVKVSEKDVKVEQKPQAPTTKQDKVQKQPKFQYGNYR